jgi:hypothetical protein
MNNRTETYGGIMMVKGDLPAIETRAHCKVKASPTASN